MEGVNLTSFVMIGQAFQYDGDGIVWIRGVTSTASQCDIVATDLLPPIPDGSADADPTNAIKIRADAAIL